MFWARMRSVGVVLVTLALLGAGAGTALWRGGSTSAAPIPGEARQPSKPVGVVQDGLEVAVALVKPAFALDEPPALDITYTNRTDKGFRLNDVAFAVSHYAVLDLGANGGPWQAGPWRFAARPAPLTVELAPGKTHVQRHTLRGPFTWQGEQAAPVAPVESLRPGKYRLTAHLVFRGESGANGVPFWTGEITAKPVEFAITTAPPVTDATTGITVTVTDDARSVTGTNAQGKLVWKAILVAPAKNALTAPAITGVAINAAGHVEVHFGKRDVAVINLESGKRLE